MLTINELNDRTIEELEILYKDLSKEIYDLKCELSVAKKLEKPHLLGEKKRDRARVMTLLNQKSQAKV